MDPSNNFENLELIDPVPSSHSQEPRIQITSAIFEKSNLSKYVAYEIKLFQNNEKLELRKRYTEFKQLRKQLLQTWGGTYIPPLPPKKLMVTSTKGKFDPSFIESRRKILEKFLQQCIKIPHLSNSEIFQSFLKGLEPSSEKITIFHIQTLFEVNFANYVGAPVKADYHANLVNAKKNFEVALSELQVFKRFVDKTSEQLYKHQKGSNSFMDSFSILAGVYLCRNVEVKTRDLLFNPYWVLRDWVNSEILDTEAMIEAILVIENYDEVIKKLINKAEGLDEKLKNALGGKKGISNFFKDRDGLVKESTEALEKCKRETVAYENVRNVLYNFMIDVDVFKFISSKSSVFHNCLKEYISQHTEEYENQLGMISVLASNFTNYS
jgi:hypothetical protein